MTAPTLQPPGARRRRLMRAGWLALVVAITFWSARGIDAAPGALWCNLWRGSRLLRESWPPEWSFWPQILGPMLETLQIAVVGTLLGGVLAVPIAVLAARNLSPWRWLWLLARALMNVTRTLPDLFWAMLFAAAAGFGAVAGALSLTLFTVMVIAKLWSESLEAIDMRPLTAARACGGGWLAQMRWGALPQALPHYVGYSLYAFELNVRASMVLGLVGAGGIGTLLETQRATFEYPRVTLIIVTVLVVILLIERLSTSLRRRLT